MNTVLRIACVAFVLVNGIEASPLHAHGRRHTHSHLHRRGAGSIVTNAKAYLNNGNTNDGGSATNTPYTYYSGPASNFPDPSEWVSFDAMFEANRPIMSQSCGWNNWGPDNSNHLNNYIKTYIQDVARDSLVDHRIILAIIMQESNGCLRVPTTNNGVRNPGLMQSHNGMEFNPAAPCTTIHQMIIDGTQGTVDGDGLVQLVNTYGDYYSAARAYNSGSIASSGNLSDGNGATSCYVSDIANRLTGWTDATSTCPH